MNQEQFLKALADKGIQLSNKQLKQFEKFQKIYNILDEKNKTLFC